MTKKQKIWLGVFLAMFIIPEVLWSPVGNVLYGLLQNNNNVKLISSNFFTNPDNINYFIFILSIQFIGILGVWKFILKANINLVIKLILIAMLTILLFLVGFVWYYSFTLRHGIGF